MNEMNRRIAAAWVLYCLSLFPGTGWADITVDQVSPKLSVAGSLRTRWEGWNWFEPAGTQNNDYDFIGTTARLGVKWKDDMFEVFVEGQNSALIDLPTTATAPAPQGALGLGGVYFAHNRTRNDASVFLKQGSLTLRNFGIDGVSIKGGRFEFSEGNEALTGDATVDWVKNMRIAQRLIGPFGWSHVGRAFDGGVIAYNQAPYNVTLMASHPTQGGFDLDGMDEIDDIDLAYAGFNLAKLYASSTTDMRLFYIYYEDRRHQVKSDNRPIAVRRDDPGERNSNITIHTEGAHMVHAFKSKPGTLDVMVYGVVQEGDWGKLDHIAWAWDCETGFQPAGFPGKPWLRIGYSRSSGDQDPADDDHETFFSILPTVRPYAFSTFYNMMNTEDAFIQLVLRPIPGLVSRTDYHNVRITEPHDLWYQGSGATIGKRDRPEGFGYPGRPANGKRALLNVVETSLGYDWNAYLNTNVYYGHVFGSGLVRDLFSSDDADFAYLEVTAKF